tara:strand:- start:863 stop:1303 length:441 start_codon:yes stop_codon:yes gene_type:complete
MIYTLSGPLDPLTTYVKDDPVRPHIPFEDRFGLDRFVFALVDDEDTNKVLAMVCTKMCHGAPASEEELLADDTDLDTIVFYTIWSYGKGAGQELLRKVLAKAKVEMPGVKRFVTLSPQTEMARKFHLKNGATIFRINESSVNYEYK